MTALIRRVCAQTLSLPSLPAEVAVTGPGSDAEAVVADFAEQFSIDVSMIGDEQRGSCGPRWGTTRLASSCRCTSPTSFRGCGPDWKPSGSASGTWAGRRSRRVGSHRRPVRRGVQRLSAEVARLRELDALTSEVVRLRGATQHNCRLCKSLRETTALNAGGSETLYGDIERFEASAELTGRQKAALRYADALIWSPSLMGRGVAAGVRAHFSDAEAVELTFDVMRNASNKVAVALGGDAPRVEQGTEQYLLDVDGQTVFS